MRLLRYTSIKHFIFITTIFTVIKNIYDIISPNQIKRNINKEKALVMDLRDYI